MTVTKFKTMLLVFIFVLAASLLGLSGQEKSPDVKSKEEVTVKPGELNETGNDFKFKEADIPGFPKDKIIKDIVAGPDSRSVMSRSKFGIQAFELSHKDRMITFQLYHSAWNSPDEIIYQYKMEAFDSTWIPADGSKRSITYTNLPAGQYFFKIKRIFMDSNKVASTVESSVPFSITPTLWGNKWFRIAVFLAVAGLIAIYFIFFYKGRLKRMTKFKEQELKITRMESQIAEAELKALKAQLHPHFLFNTLNAISSLMRENVEAADDAMTQLGDLLRSMFSNSGRQMVPLKDEIDFINIYLQLHQLRFQDKLQVNMEIAGNTINTAIPNFLLQPLVENAVIHGTSKDKNDNKILVRTRRHNGRLIIRIQDNGPGIPSLETGGLLDMEKGFGLKNTYERLKNQYGGDFKFKVENSLEGGLIVAVDIPSQSMG